MHLYFSDIFDVSPKALDKYGAFKDDLRDVVTYIAKH